MSQPLLALAFQDAAPDNSMWIIVGVVLVILVFIVVIVGVGLTIFFIARKRSKAQKSDAAAAMSSAPIVPILPDASASPSEPFTPDVAQYPIESSGVNQSDAAALAQGPSDVLEEEEHIDPDFDPSRTVAINREPTVAISFGSIKFVSGVLAGQKFDVVPEGSFIGRDSGVSQIVVNDPRISKRHLWIGVRDGAVMIADQASRNGTFLNDPQSERITETKLNSGDTVIMGESDVARFEYEA